LQAHQLQTVCGGDGTLAFGAGLSNPDEPDVWLRDFTQATRLWIEVGAPEEKPILRACGKSDVAMVYCFNHAAEIWWKAMENKVSRAKNLQIWRVPTLQSQELAKLATRSMQLQADDERRREHGGCGVRALAVSYFGDETPSAARSA
jgi:uncharacterized protein YaeQ